MDTTTTLLHELSRDFISEASKHQLPHNPTLHFYVLHVDTVACDRVI